MAAGFLYRSRGVFVSLFRRIVTEPLLQFIVIGAALFALYAILDSGAEPEAGTPTIIVTPGRVDHLAEVFSRTWQRAPTPEELGDLVDAYIKEEVYYREGRRLGLDLDDTIVRRRLQQKMEFLLEPDTETLTPKPGELEAFLAEHATVFQFPEEIAFQQIYFDPEDRAEPEADAAAALADLQAGGTDAAEVGDPTLLPASMTLSTPNQIAGTFGGTFLDGLEGLPSGAWTGPIPSTFGIHLVRVDDRKPARVPALEEVLDQVTLEWRAQMRMDMVEDRYREILQGYEIIIEEREPETGEDAGT